MRRNPFRLALVSAGLAALVGRAGRRRPGEERRRRAARAARPRPSTRSRTQAAIDTLKAGGNAVDAAVAAAAVLGVTEPFSCGIGGGGFMVIRTADGDVTTIDGREKAPARDAARTRSSRTAGRSRSTPRASAASRPACPARR